MNTVSIGHYWLNERIALPAPPPFKFKQARHSAPTPDNFCANVFLSPQHQSRLMRKAQFEVCKV